MNQQTNKQTNKQKKQRKKIITHLHILCLIMIHVFQINCQLNSYTYFTFTCEYTTVTTKQFTLEND
jgi:hypothetical protein